MSCLEDTLSGTPSLWLTCLHALFLAVISTNSLNAWLFFPKALSLPRHLRSSHPSEKSVEYLDAGMPERDDRAGPKRSAQGSIQMVQQKRAAAATRQPTTRGSGGDLVKRSARKDDNLQQLAKQTFVAAGGADSACHRLRGHGIDCRCS